MERLESDEDSEAITNWADFTVDSPIRKTRGSAAPTVISDHVRLQAIYTPNVEYNVTMSPMMLDPSPISDKITNGPHRLVHTDQVSCPPRLTTVICNVVATCVHQAPCHAVGQGRGRSRKLVPCSGNRNRPRLNPAQDFLRSEKFCRPVRWQAPPGAGNSQTHLHDGFKSLDF